MARCPTLALPLVALTSASIAAGQATSPIQDGPASVNRTEESIDLTWRAAAGCPPVERVREEITRILGGPPPATSKRRVLARASVVRTGKRWTLRIETEVAGQRGSRTLDAASCEELGEAAALIVALAFDPEAVAATQANKAQREPDAPAPEPAPAPVANAPPTPSPTKATAPAARAPKARAGPPPRKAAGEQPLQVSIGAGASADAGALPSPAIGFGGALGVTVRPLRFDVGATYWLGQRRTVGAEGAGGQFQFFTVLATACPVARTGRFELGLCPGFELGRMAASGFNVDHPGQSSVFWAALYGGAAVTVDVVGPMAARLGAGAIVPFTRPNWLLVRVGDVDRPGPITGRAWLGVELRL